MAFQGRRCSRDDGPGRPSYGRFSPAARLTLRQIRRGQRCLTPGGDDHEAAGPAVYSSHGNLSAVSPHLPPSTGIGADSYSRATQIRLDFLKFDFRNGGPLPGWYGVAPFADRRIETDANDDLCCRTGSLSGNRGLWWIGILAGHRVNGRHRVSARPANGGGRAATSHAFGQSANVVRVSHGDRVPVESDERRYSIRRRDSVV